MRTTTQTPWGPSQHRTRIAEGITTHSTAGHGGIELSMPRFIEFKARFPDFETFAGGPWFEEDQDAAAVVLAFPEHFTDEQMWSAIRTVNLSIKLEQELYAGKRNRGWSSISNWLLFDTEGQRISARAKAFELSITDKWEVGGMGTPSNRNAPSTAWDVHLKRHRDGASRWVTFVSYPDQRFYTDAELADSVWTPGQPVAA